MVNATYFTYDGVFSGQYGLQIADFTGLVPESVEENEAFSPSLSTLKVPSSLRFYHGGVEYDSPPACEFSVVSENVIPPEMRSVILSWLIGRKTFKPLKFLNDDMEDFVYYCVFTGSSTIYVNGECHGFRLTASFDSPFARGPSSVLTVQTPNDEIVNQMFTINNKSDIRDGYTYPTIRFKVGSTKVATSDGYGNVDIWITNMTDDSSQTRPFVFKGLATNEIVTVDCETKVISSTVGGEKLSKFVSKNWLRLRPGMNSLHIATSGDTTITCPWYAMIAY